MDAVFFRLLIVLSLIPIKLRTMKTTAVHFSVEDTTVANICVSVCKSIALQYGFKLRPQQTGMRTPYSPRSLFISWACMLKTPCLSTADAT